MEVFRNQVGMTPQKAGRALVGPGQRGAFLATAALTLLFLVGFMGLAIDFGRLFVVKSELQNALDSCALAAVRELNGEPDALDRARMAGRAVGNLHRVNFQKQTIALTDGDVLFSSTLTGAYSASPAGTARYVRCEKNLSGLAPFMLQAMDAFAGTRTGTAQEVGALAVATTLPSQSNCLMPIGICRNPSSSNPGVTAYSRGDWILGVRNSQQDRLGPGRFAWLDLPPSGGGASDLRNIIGGVGRCGVSAQLPALTAIDTQSGRIEAAAKEWNSRFGIYDQNDLRKGAVLTLNPPDRTGHSWYWNDDTQPPPTLSGRYDAADGYRFHQGRNSRFQGNAGADLTGLNAVKGNDRIITSAEHLANGVNRRVVTVVEVDCANSALPATGFACVLLLHPMRQGGAGGPRMWLEYLGDASAFAGNPCVSSGLPGDSGGVRVPALVQ